MAYMEFELMHRDVHVADVDISEVDGDMFRLREVHSLDHMPMGTLREGRGDVLNLGRWWARRSIPESRSGLRRLLERAGLPDARSDRPVLAFRGKRSTSSTTSSARVSG